MKVYVIIENNYEDYEDYREWIEGIYANKEIVEKRIMELTKNDTHERDRATNIKNFCEEQGSWAGGVGLYRIEVYEGLE